MKTIKYNLINFAAAALAALAVLSCEQPVEHSSGTPAASGGMSHVIITASTGNSVSAFGGVARTILPATPPVFSRYKLVLKAESNPNNPIVIENAALGPDDGMNYALPAGTWTAKVTAYRTYGGGEYAAAEGSATWTATLDETTALTVYIEPVSGITEPGKFTYTVTFPAGASGTLQFGTETPVPLVSGQEVSVEKAPGYYNLTVSLAKGENLSAGLWEKVHIYAGLESKAAFTFADADFTATVYLAGTLALPAGVSVSGGTVKAYSDAGYTAKIGQANASASWIVGVPATHIGSTVYLMAIATGTNGNTYIGTGNSGGAVPETGAQGIAVTAIVYGNTSSIAGVSAYLQSASGGASASNPILLPVELNLAETSNGWTSLLSAISSAGKYVALDLSACTGNAEFDPGTESTGKNRIVSLVLPDTATSVKAGPYSEGAHHSTFQHFNALKSVSGANVQTIGDYAFIFCNALASVSLPEATSIGESAFRWCGTLATVSLPKATSIGNYAFSDCGALTTVILPAATSIGAYAFSDCDALTTVTLGSTAPTLGYSMLYGITARTVTVKVPSGAAGYGTPATYSGTDTTTNWGNGFRGGGWTGSVFDPYGGVSYINTDITVVVQYQ
jgi:hypothetical protein